VEHLFVMTKRRRSALFSEIGAVVKAEFEGSDLPLSKLASNHGICRQTLYKWQKVHGWKKNSKESLERFPEVEKLVKRQLKSPYLSSLKEIESSLKKDGAYYSLLHNHEKKSGWGKVVLQEAANEANKTTGYREQLEQFQRVVDELKMEVTGQQILLGFKEC